jgi:hypothetical protein
MTMTPVRKRVQSTLFRSIGYDAASCILELEFVPTGAVYEYYDVPLSVYFDLLDAPSKGRYYNDEIKDSYAGRRIDPPEGAPPDQAGGPEGVEAR